MYIEDQSLAERLHEIVRQLSATIQEDPGRFAHVIGSLASKVSQHNSPQTNEELANRIALHQFGFNDWQMAYALLEGRLKPGDDFGAFWYEASTDMFLNDWCASYDEARQALKAGETYLLPFRRQFFLAGSGFLGELGLDAQDPAWKTAGYDLAIPKDIGAYQRIALARLNAKHEKLNSIYKGQSLGNARSGVFSIRCSVTADTWIGYSWNLDGVKNGLWFFLRKGSHLNHDLQAAWNTYGETGFQFEIIETVAGNLSLTELENLLKQRMQHWKAELQASEVFY